MDRKKLPHPVSLTFALDQAGYTYDGGHVGLAPTDITASELRVAVTGLDGAGKSTLLDLLDGSSKANAGMVAIAGGEERPDPAVRKDTKRIDSLVGKVRREGIPNGSYQATSISEAVSEALREHKASESEYHTRIGNLFAHFDLAQVSEAKANKLGSEKRHPLAIAVALSSESSAIAADKSSRGLDEIGVTHVAKMLFGYNKQVISATHGMDMICRPEYTIDRVPVLGEHAVAFDGVPAETMAFCGGLTRHKYEVAKR